MPLQAPTFADVLAARETIRDHLPRTPLRSYPALDRMVGAAVWVKHENLMPTGAFKVRGGINLMSQLDFDTRRQGVITASTGNHGQSVAYGAHLFGIPATVCVPEHANPVKVEAMRDLGAEVICVGRAFDEARAHCEALAAERGLRYVHTGNEPDLIAGVATCTLEILEDQPEIDVLLVAVGGGSGASAACIVARAVRPTLEVIGVQSAQSPAAHDSWRAGAMVERPNTTTAEGVATGTAFELPQRIMRQLAHRLRPGRGSGPAHRDAADDREDAHAGGAGRSRPAGRRPRPGPGSAAAGPPGRPGLLGGQHQPRPARRGTGGTPHPRAELPEAVGSGGARRWGWR